MMIIKRIIITKLQLLVAFILFFSTVQAQEVALDKIAAVVNNDVVMFSEVRRNARLIKQSGNSKLSDQDLMKETLDKLILQRIQVQRAKEIGLKVDNIALNEAMSRIAAQNKLNLEQFRVALIKEGFNYKNFRETIRDKLYIEILQKRQQGRNKKITDYEIDNLIKAESHVLNKDVQYHLIDILIPAPNGISVVQFNQARQRAQILRKRLLKNPGKLSQTLIKKMGASSNNIGWKTTQSLSPVFVRTLSLMGVGELSSIVRSPQGFHILKLLEQRGGQRKITQQARVRHILISKDTPQAKLKATQLRNKILAGENFAKLAKENSADTGSAQDGGELGLMDPTSFVPPFANAVRQLPLNSLSQPIQTRFGWHILEVLERKNSDQTREALKAQAQSVISERNQSKEYNNWLQGLRDEAFVEYRI